MDGPARQEPTSVTRVEGRSGEGTPSSVSKVSAVSAVSGVTSVSSVTSAVISNHPPVAEAAPATLGTPRMPLTVSVRRKAALTAT